MIGRMPVMNGPAACTVIRAMGCDAFIVGITGNVLPEDFDCFRKSGANHTLPKPVDMKVLENLWVEYGITEQKRMRTDSIAGLQR